MKNKLFLVPLLLLCSFSVTSCEPAEDGDINEWIGEYSWGQNRLEHWHKPITGDDYKTGSNDYRMDEVNLSINEDKTWKLPDPKGLGKTGKVKCYKDHINLLEMQNDYVISPNFAFKLTLETGGTFLEYKHDESEGRRGSNYNYDIRIVYFKKINK